MKTYISIIFFLLLTGCAGVSLEDTKKEMLPLIQKNTDALDSISKNQTSKFTQISDNVLYMEKEISKINDRIKGLQLFVEKEIAEQNDYLVKISKMDYDSLQKEEIHLSIKLDNLRKRIIDAKRKSKLVSERSNILDKKKDKPSKEPDAKKPDLKKDKN